MTGKSERTVMDEQSEIAAGAKAHPQVLAEFGAYDDPKVQAYVNDLGQRLAKASHRPQLEWHFTVLDSPEINAFALPGGYVYITRGIMAYMDSEADLAGVTGHEIGHVTARHGSQRATRQQAAGIGVLAATILGAVLESGGVPGAAQAASQASQGVAAGYIAKYSRAQESQADKLGAEYLADVNYDPRNMVDVIKLLESQERFAAEQARAEGRTPQTGSDWLASHPTSEQRLRDITQIASEYEAKANFSDEDRTGYLKMINGMAFGESRRPGRDARSEFLSRAVGFRANGPARLEDSKLAGGGRDRERRRQRGVVRPGGAAKGRAVTTRRSSATRVKPDSGSVERRTLNGLSATHFIGTRTNEQGQSQPVELTIVTGPSDRVYAIVYAARDQQSLQRRIARCARRSRRFAR